MSRYVLALDFGHGGARVLFLDLESGKRFSSYQGWQYFSLDNDDFKKEFNPTKFFDTFCNLVKDLVKNHSLKPDEVVGVSTASMRHSNVFLDKNGKEIYAGPNTDTRGLFYQDIIEDEINLDVFKITGQWPPLLFMPTRLLWFREEKPEAFNQIKYALTTGDWLIYKLTGEMACEPSLASSTMLYDLHKKRWLSEILETLDMGDIVLPDVYNAGHRIGELKEDVAKKMNLKRDVPVAIGGGDTQLGLLACSATDEDDIGVVAGTSTPVMMVTSKPVVDDEQRVWTHFHVLPNRWVLESNAQMGGLTYQWMKNNIKQIANISDNETYKYMEKLATGVPPGSDDVITSLGSEILNINALSVVRPGLFTFPQPAHPMNEKPASFAHFIRATLENICFAIRGNIEQLENIVDKKNTMLRVTGGMSKNNLWLQILADATGKKIIASSFEEGTSVGSAICASVGAKFYKNLEDAVENIAKFKKEIIPDNKNIDVYNSCYNNWKKWYDKLAEI